ncbi:TetR/AcrR family transcriptional regulator [Pokkaliibacter plantistimulans]|nr:TetR/AcrR family transcriptional regulator [Pokkaliibacter plantistimulans]
MPENPGRPRGDSDARARLISAAQQLFTAKHYQNVSTRELARYAGVDAALIRYYFGGKPGLFEQMVRETMAPMLAQFQQLAGNDAPADLSQLMQTYYTVIGSNPGLPRLLMRVLHEDQGSEPYHILLSIFSDVLRLSQQWLMKGLVASGRLRADMDPQLARLSFVSLMVFPLIAPPALVSQLGVTLDQQGLQGLIPHHLAVLSDGVLAHDVKEGQ